MSMAYQRRYDNRRGAFEVLDAGGKSGAVRAAGYHARAGVLRGSCYGGR